MAEKIASFYRGRLAREKGTVRKDWGGRISIALTYPNSYRIGMSNLGFQVVYHLLNQREDVVAERVFLPESPKMPLRVEGGEEILSLESLSPLRRFDLVAFSLSFENDYPNVLKILDLGRIPLLSEGRDSSFPLVMAGGVTTFLNPEPLAPFIDFFLAGEAEAVLLPFLDFFSVVKKRWKRKKETLRELARDVPSLYVPSLYRVEYHQDGTIRSREPLEATIPAKIRIAHPDDLPSPVTTSAILTPDTEFASKVLVELGRGCGRACRFCAAGHIYRPPRNRGEEEIISCVEDVMKGERQLGLLAACASDIPGIERVMGFIADRGGHFSVSSLRADGLTEEMLRCLKESGQKTLAIAPEAGSERLRKVINKHLTEVQLIQAVQKIAGSGHFALRLYFLVGLPTETQEDVSEILRLLKTLKHWLVKGSRARGRIGQIRLSVNCFIPKAFTPFQWVPMEDVNTLKEKQKWLKGAFRREGGIKVSFDLPKWAYVQSLLSVGDRRVGSILLLAHRHEGNWAEACRHSDVNPDFFVHRPKGLDEVLPWDFLDHGIRREHLVKEYRLALRGVESDVCQVGQCTRCGVCPPRTDVRE